MFGLVQDDCFLRTLILESSTYVGKRPDIDREVFSNLLLDSAAVVVEYLV